MMLEQHHDDETLIAMLEAGDTNDAHLRSCEDCTETLEALKDISSALHHEDVWERREMDEKPVGASIAMLRAAADRLQDEAGQAEMLLDDLLRLAPAMAENVVRNDVRYQTAGVARKLVELVETEKDVDPRRALNIADLAVAAAESLNDTPESRQAVAVLRGGAYRQQGVTLSYAGRYPEALQAFDRSEAALQRSAGGAYEMGRVFINRTVVLVTLDRVDEAMASARQGQRAFAQSQDLPRLAAARFAEAYVLMKLNDWRKALNIFEAIRTTSIDALTDDVQARVYGNVGLCQMNLGNNALAATNYYQAARLFQQAGTKSEAARMHWHLAHLARAESRIEEAVRRFDEVSLEFAGLGMVAEAASAHLDTAETLASIGKYERVEELCRAAIRQYEISGLGYTARALTALAYLKEAAQHRRATAQVVQHVREYLRRLPQEPALLFAPPPEPPPQNLG